MIKVFIPIDKKVKTNVRGLWLNDKHKLFYDYLKIKSYAYLYGKGLANHYAIRQLKFLKSYYKQEALFFTSGYYKELGKAFMFYNPDKIETLKNRIYKEVKRQDLKVTIKEALRQYKGCTIYQKTGRYYIEIYF